MAAGFGSGSSMLVSRVDTREDVALVLYRAWSYMKEFSMNKKALCIVSVCFAAAGLSSQVFADDSNSTRPIVSPKQMMKDCVTKERQQNPRASEDDMKKTCRAKIASYNEHPSETTAPPNNP
jgi:hypothetical protein